MPNYKITQTKLNRMAKEMLEDARNKKEEDPKNKAMQDPLLKALKG